MYVYVYKSNIKHMEAGFVPTNYGDKFNIFEDHEKRDFFVL